jgi:murein DD-endopeptidase MepM/ murein hydrolase activator NlpD
MTPAAPSTPATEQSAKPIVTYPRTVALLINKGDTIANLLVANHVRPEEAHKVVDALKSQISPSQIKPGQRISVTLARHESIGDAAAVKELAIKLPGLSAMELQRLENGDFKFAGNPLNMTELKIGARRGYGVVRTSLFQAGSDGGIPASAMREVIKAFSYDVDFQRDIHPGDTIEVLMGKTAQGYGPLRYAALTLRGKKREIFAFKDASGQTAWFDAKGNSIKKSLLRTPLDGAEVTSGFGMRTHPILGYSKFHKGVDFGAPTGTPVMAAGDGVVEERGWKNGYGNFLLIRHNGTYETAYGHLSRFGNIKVGSRVKQGQVVAYVGMTGMATGPHLHYEVRQKDVQVNPVAKQFNLQNGLSGKQLATFTANKQAMMQDLAALGGSPVKTSAIASAESKPAAKSRKTASVRKSGKSLKVASR